MIRLELGLLPLSLLELVVQKFQINKFIDRNSILKVVSFSNLERAIFNHPNTSMANISSAQNETTEHENSTDEHSNNQQQLPYQSMSSSSSLSSPSFSQQFWGGNQLKDTSSDDDDDDDDSTDPECDSESLWLQDEKEDDDEKDRGGTIRTLPIPRFEGLKRSHRHRENIISPGMPIIRY